MFLENVDISDFSEDNLSLIKSKRRALKAVRINSGVVLGSHRKLGQLTEHPNVTFTPHYVLLSLFKIPSSICFRTSILALSWLVKSLKEVISKKANTVKKNERSSYHAPARDNHKIFMGKMVLYSWSGCLWRVNSRLQTTV